MTSWRRSGVPAFILSVLIGSVCGVLMILLWIPPSRGEDIPIVFIMLLWATLFSLPYVGIGLLLLGLPVTWLLHRHILEPWFGLVAAVWGAVGGSIFYHLFYAGAEGLEELTGVKDAGPLYGIPTGLAWWLLYRRVVADRDTDEEALNSQ